MLEADERNIEPIQLILKLIHHRLNPEKWGFKESFRSNKSNDVIYDSEWCRVRIGWMGWDYLAGHSISIYYGRLHASDIEAKIVFQGEDCRCWHGLWGTGEIINFLEGLSPQQTATQKGWPPILEHLSVKELGDQSDQPSRVIQIHAAIWQHYGQRLFELFDLRRPNLWEEYRHFIKEVYKIKGLIPEIKPPLDKVC
jgi:hypothetical protein